MEEDSFKVMEEAYGTSESIKVKSESDTFLIKYIDYIFKREREERDHVYQEQRKVERQEFQQMMSLLLQGLNGIREEQKAMRAELKSWSEKGFSDVNDQLQVIDKKIEKSILGVEDKISSKFIVDAQREEKQCERTDDKEDEKSQRVNNLPEEIKALKLIVVDNTQAVSSGSNLGVKKVVNLNEDTEKDNTFIIPKIEIQSQPPKVVHIKIFKGDVGENPQSHLESLKDYFKCCKIAPDEQVIIASHHLHGYAREWWSLIKDKPGTMKDYSDKILKYFWSEKRQGGLLNKLYEEKYGTMGQETYMQFFVRQATRFKALTAFTFSDAHVIDTIQRNMPLCIQQMMASSRIREIGEMTEFLMNLDFCPWNKEPPDREKRVYKS